jgi:GGDEF domain-containing protein
LPRRASTRTKARRAFDNARAPRDKECLAGNDAREHFCEALIPRSKPRQTFYSVRTARNTARGAQNAVIPCGRKTGHTTRGVSIGVTLAHPGESTDALIARADEAMYRAKQHGRNQVITIKGTSAL